MLKSLINNFWLLIFEPRLLNFSSKFKVQTSRFKAQNFSQILRFSGFQFQKKTYQLHIVNFQWCNWYVSTDDEF